MKHFNLAVGETIQTIGSKDEKNGVNDQMYVSLDSNLKLNAKSTFQWLDAPSQWNGHKVPSDIKFRRPIKNLQDTTIP